MKIISDTDAALAATLVHWATETGKLADFAAWLNDEGEHEPLNGEELARLRRHLADLHRKGTPRCRLVIPHFPEPEPQAAGDG